MLSRRAFLRRSAVAAGVAAFPMVVPSTALGLAGSVAPSNRIALGLIGLGQEGHLKNLRGFIKEPDVQVAGLCDVVRQRVDRAHLVLQTYPEQSNVSDYKNCFLTMDWRELVARDDIDAVIVSTPDHWHALCSIGALRAGKHVMCEKPIAHTIHEGRVMSDTARRYARVCQVGSEVRFMPQLLQAVRMVRNGRIGKLHTIHVKMYGGFGTPGNRFSPPVDIQTPPPGFNYDMWLGPAPEAPFTLARCNGTFRFIYDYGGGNICEWGPHMLDIAMLGNDTETTGPIRVEGNAEFSAEGLFDTPLAFQAKYNFANGVTLHCETGGIELKAYGGAYVRFEGGDGWIQAGFSGLEASREELRTERLGPGDDPIVVTAHEGMEHRAFLDAVKREQPCLDPVEAAHRVASVSHLGNIAFRLGVPLEWDPLAEQFTNNEAANRLLRPHMRAPWALEG